LHIDKRRENSFLPANKIQLYGIQGSFGPAFIRYSLRDRSIDWFSTPLFTLAVVSSEKVKSKKL